MPYSPPPGNVLDLSLLPVWTAPPGDDLNIALDAGKRLIHAECGFPAFGGKVRGSGPIDGELACGFPAFGGKGRVAEPIESDLASGFPAFGGSVVDYQPQPCRIDSVFPAFGGAVKVGIATHCEFQQHYGSFIDVYFGQPWVSSSFLADFVHPYRMTVPVEQVFTTKYSDLVAATVEFSQPYQSLMRKMTIMDFRQIYSLMPANADYLPWMLIVERMD